MFAEYGEVIEHKPCVRCGSGEAVRRAKPEPGTSIAQCYITCPKCHLISWDGITTAATISDEALLKKLNKNLDKAKTPGAKRKIQLKIDKVTQRKEFRELGL